MVRNDVSQVAVGVPTNYPFCIRFMHRGELWRRSNRQADDEAKGKAEAKAKAKAISSANGRSYGTSHTSRLSCCGAC